MKNALTIVFLLSCHLAQAQEFFQRRFNLSAYPAVRNERFNSGIRTQDNFDANNAYYYVGIGTSYNNTSLASPHNIADRLRFTRLSKAGNAVLTNLGYHFLKDGRALQASGNSIAEVRNTSGNGGYVAVGAVANNQVTGSFVPGTSDVLFTRLSPIGAVVVARRIDIGGGHDIAWSIRRSVVQVNNQPTWLICGQSRRNTAATDAFVARVDMNGNIIWGNHFNFDPGGGLFNSAHNIARQLCEDAAGNIYVVGTLQDYSWANGTDGLVFKLTPAGALVWANNYHLAADDAFQAVRLTAAGNLIVGGFTNSGGQYNMQITSLSTAAGGIIFQNILRASIGGAFYPSRCYDIIEAPGPQYYLAGVLEQNGVNKQMLYRVGAGGAGISWNSYNAMAYKEGFGLHLIPGPNCPGIAYFSSMKNPGNPAFSDGHIMKTDLATRTCNYPEPKAPARLPSGLIRYPRQYRVQRTFYGSELTWSGFNYQSWNICWVDCPSPTGARMAAEPTTSDMASVETPEAASTRLLLAPNPVKDIVHVVAQGLPAGAYRLELRDMNGRQIQRKSSVHQAGALAINLDLTTLPPGIYLLTLKQGKLVLQQKLVKQ